jgi:PAS domain S-box-containing protein
MRIKGSLAIPILALLITVAVSTLLAGYYLNLHSLRGSLEKKEMEKTKNTLYLIKSLISEEIKNLSALSKALKENRELSSALLFYVISQGDIDPLKGVINRLFPEINVDIFDVIDSKGKSIYCAKAHGTPKEDYRDVWGFEEVLTGQEQKIVGIGPHGWAIKIFMPVFSGGRFLGIFVLGSEINDRFAQRIAEATNTQVSIATLKSVFASSLTGDQRNLVNFETIKGSLWERTPYFILDDNRSLLLMYAPLRVVDETFGLIIQADTKAMHELFDRNRRRLIQFSIIILSVVILAGFTLTLYLVRPLKNLQKKVQELANKASGKDLKPVASGNEIQELVRGFDLMSEMIDSHVAECKRAEETARKNENEARRLAHENKVLAEVGKIISSTLNIEETYEMFAAEVRKLIPFDRIVVNLNNPKEGTVTTAYSSGVHVEGRRKGDVFPLKGTMNEEMIRTRSGVLIQTESIEELKSRFPGLISTFKAGILSMMSVPLISGDEVMGGLLFRSKKPKAYKDEDLRLAGSIANQIAGAIANAHLFLERKRVEEALRRNEERFRSISESLPVGVFETDNKGICIYTNTKWQKVFNVTLTESFDVPWIQFCHPDEREEVRKEWSAAIQNPESFSRECRISTSEGAVRWIQLRSSPLVSDGGVRYIGTVEDITDRKQAEEALRRSEEESYRLSQENAIMAEIGRIISSTLDIDEVFEQLTKRMAKLISFDRVLVNLLSPEKNSTFMRYVAGIDIPQRQLGGQVPLEGSATGECLRKKVSLLIQPEQPENMEEIRCRLPGLWPTLESGIRSLIVVPLISGDQAIGVLSLRSTRSKAYTDQDVTLCESIASQIAGAIANAQLFDELKRAEEAIKRGKEFYETILNSMKDPLSIIGVRDYRIVDLNKAFLERLNKERDEVIGRTCYEITHRSSAPCGPPEHQCPIAGVLATGKSSVTEHLHYGEDKVKRHAEVSASPIRDDDGKIIQIVHLEKDVTEQKNLQSQLVQVQKLEAVGQLAAGIAHEINTPTQYVGDNVRFLQDSFADLNAVLGKCGRLLEAVKSGEDGLQAAREVEETIREIDLPYLTGEIPRAIQQTLEGVERVTKIVRAMKEFSHPGVKEKTIVDLNKAIENTVTVCRHEWRYVAEMILELEPSLPQVPCLLGEFNQVVLNIVINAAQAIADVVGDGSGGKGEIRVVTRQEGDGVEVRISDTGGGIPENIRSRIFDPFFTTKTVGKGTGQGLTIAHSIIVEKHGGTIHFKTETGKGTTFIIRLPVAPGEKKQ